MTAATKAEPIPPKTPPTIAPVCDDLGLDKFAAFEGTTVELFGIPLGVTETVEVVTLGVVTETVNVVTL